MEVCGVTTKSEISEATQVTGVLHPVVCLGDDGTTTVEEQTRLEAKTKVVNLSATKTLIYGTLALAASAIRCL